MDNTNETVPKYLYDAALKATVQALAKVEKYVKLHTEEESLRWRAEASALRLAEDVQKAYNKGYKDGFAEGYGGPGEDIASNE